MAVEKGVWMMPNSFFYAPDPQSVTHSYVRMAICKDRLATERAIDRLQNALNWTLASSFWSLSEQLASGPLGRWGWLIHEKLGITCSEVESGVELSDSWGAEEILVGAHIALSESGLKDGLIQVREEFHDSVEDCVEEIVSASGLSGVDAELDNVFAKE